VFLVTLGGLALFLLGIHRISAALDVLAGPAARRWMAAATRSPIRALLTGTGVAAVTQSGTATAVTVLGLVTSGIVAVREGLVLSLGAKLGATLAIQLAAFNLAEYALPMIGIGYLLSLWRNGAGVGGLVLGAGMLFLGLDVTVSAVGGLRDSAAFTLLIDTAEAQPLLVAGLGFVLGAALSSANGAAAIALGLFVADAVTLPTAVALLAGGNVGSTVLPILVSRTFDVGAQQVAFTHLVAKAVGAVIVVAVAGPAAQVVAAIGGDGARQVANAHTLFNLAVALLGVTFAGPLAKLSHVLAPAHEDDSAPKYLRPDAIAQPALAIAFAQRETVRVSDQVAVMMELSAGFLRTGRWDTEPIEAREAKIDRLTHQVVDYLARMRREHGEDPESERLMLVVTELEHMGDQIRRLARREGRLRETGVEFSRKGRAELSETAEMVAQRMRMAYTAMATGEAAMAQQVLEERLAFVEHVARMRVAHLARLEAQMPESRASSSHHLEVLTLLRDVDASVTRVAAEVLAALGKLERTQIRTRSPSLVSEDHPGEAVARGRVGDGEGRGPSGDGGGRGSSGGGGQDEGENA